MSAPDPTERLNKWLWSSGPAGHITESHGGRYPSANDARNMMDDLDEAVDRPLPEGVKTVRGMHDISYFQSYVPGDITSIRGTTQAPGGFMSASLGDDPIRIGPNEFSYTMRLDVPEGTRGLWMGTNSRFPNQRELIMPRNTEILIRDAWETSPGRYVIHAEVVPSEGRNQE